MNTIHAAMLVALGFLAATLAGLLLAPLYRRRTVRLTTERIKRTMPLDEAEIRADKDRLRAEFAILIHNLEAKVESASHAAARQRIELNRRDAAISALEGDVSRLSTMLDGHENARRVLEQTITDRLPKVESRLAEAKKMLFQRDREIAILTQSADKQMRALDEATQINTQQRDEIYRLSASLATRASRNREGLSDPRFDGEVALRAEIEALRAKTREQTSLITRLQGLLARGAAQDGSGDAKAANGAGHAGDAYHPELEEEITRLKSDLSEAEDALRSVRNSAEAGQAGQAALQAEIRSLKSARQDQGAEIARLKAALATYELAEKDDKATKESKMAMKVRLSSLQAQADEQLTIIQTLRAELAAANERIARQATHYRDEMRRLGAGTVPTTGQPRRVQKESGKRSLADRINEPRASSALRTAGGPAPAGHSKSEPPKDQSRVSGFLRALDGAKSTSGESAPANAAAEQNDNGAGSSEDAGAGDGPQQRRRGGLLERITGLDKPTSASGG